MNRFFYTACLALSPLCATPLTVTTATKLAHTQRPLLKAQHQQVAQARHRTDQAYSGYLPQLSAQYATLFDQEHSTIERSTHTITLHGSQLIFAPAGPSVQAQIAHQHTAHARHILTSTNHQVRHQTVHAFLDAWLLQAQRPVIAALQRWHSYRITHESALYDAAQRTALERATTHAESAHAQATVTTYPHQLARARAALHAAMGTPLVPHFELCYTPTPPPVCASLAVYLERAYTHRPELKANSAAQRQHQLTAQSHRAQYLPRIDMHGSVGRTFAGTGPDRGTHAQIGLRAHWRFFDGLQQYHAAHASDADELRTRFERQELRTTIRTQVTNAYYALKTACQHLEAAQRTYQVNQQQWRADRDAYELHSMAPLTYYERAYHAEKAAHELRTHQIAVHKCLETLNWRCGYAQRRERTPHA